jgi:hypothetical protein
VGLKHRVGVEPTLVFRFRRGDARVAVAKHLFDSRRLDWRRRALSHIDPSCHSKSLANLNEYLTKIVKSD